MALVVPLPVWGTPRPPVMSSRSHRPNARSASITLPSSSTSDHFPPSNRERPTPAPRRLSTHSSRHARHRTPQPHPANLKRLTTTRWTCRKALSSYDCRRNKHFIHTLMSGKYNMALYTARTGQDVQKQQRGYKHGQGRPYEGIQPEPAGCLFMKKKRRKQCLKRVLFRFERGLGTRVCVCGGVSDTPVPHLDHRSRGWGNWHDSHRLGVRLRSSFFHVCIVGDLDGVFLFTRRLAV